MLAPRSPSMQQRRMYLSFWDKHSHGIILSRTQCEICDPVDAKVTPNGIHLCRFVELNLICDHPGTVFFIVGILKIPSRLGLLHECYNVLSRRSYPDFEILRGIPVFLLSFRRCQFLGKVNRFRNTRDNVLGLSQVIM